MSVEAPLVSIVTPSFNQARFLEETIRSVLEQDYPRIEYAVVDGGSSDGSVGVIERYADRLAWWVSEPDGGQPEAINKGFARSGGVLMGFLNSDDTLLPGAISRLVAALAEDPEALVAYGDVVMLDASSNRIAYGRPRVWDPAQMARCGTGTVHQAASLWRRRAWELAGPLEESYHFCFDSIFFMRMATFGHPVYVPEPLAGYRIHAGAKTWDLNQDPMIEECLRMAFEFFTADDLPPQIAKARRPSRAIFLRRAAWGYYNLGRFGRARSLFLRSLLVYPWMSRGTLTKMLRTLIPGAAVRARRRLRLRTSA